MKSDLDRHIEKNLEDKEFRIYFDKAETKRKIARKIAKLRISRHFTQTELAKYVGTKQQVISRLEDPADTRMPSFEFLDRIAKTFKKRLVISLE